MASLGCAREIDIRETAVADGVKSYFNAHLSERDPLIHDALQGEKKRQQGQIELIASENSVSAACLEALGSAITNKTVEGYLPCGIGGAPGGVAYGAKVALVTHILWTTGGAFVPEEQFRDFLARSVPVPTR